MSQWVEQFLANRPFIQLLDIIIVWYLIYKLLMYARGTQMMNLLKGVAVFIVAKFFSSLIGLRTIDWLLGQVLAWGVIAIIVLFQPELRRALEILGRDLFRNRKGTQNPNIKMIDDLESALLYMSRRKIGALISIEGEDELSEIIETGISLNSELSSQLLINIFIPNTPLHDGAVIVRDYRISAASCYLPLSESDTIPKELGTRHRAAIGLGEVTDAVTLIVSEETGDISIVYGDAINRGIKPDELHETLEHYLLKEEDKEDEHDYFKHLRQFFEDTKKAWGDRREEK